MHAAYLWLKVLYTIFILNTQLNHAIEFKFTNFECESLNESWVVINNCRLRAINRNRTVLNFNATILEAVHEMDIHFQMFQRLNGYKPWLYNLSVDVCRFHRRQYNPVATLIYNFFKDFSNLNHTCPYVGPQIVKGLYLKLERLSIPLPTADYLLKAAFFFHKKLQAQLKIYYKFVED